MTEGQEMAAGGVGAQNLHPGPDERGTGRGHRWTSHGGRGVTGCRQRVSATSFARRMNLMVFPLAQDPPFYPQPPASSLRPGTQGTLRKCVLIHHVHE